MDVPLDTALEALAGFSPLAGRGQVRQVRPVSGGTFTLIDESYNANPLSMTAGFRSLGARIVPEGGRRVVFLTDMLELGDQAEAMHAGLAEPLDAARVDVVHSAGPMMRHLHEALPPARRGVWRETAAMLADEVAALVRDGDTVMVKGSNGSRAGQIATALAGLHSDDGA
jgi:UDP-N-acetylmuramoyl-tripeptide--D-alanyl-D-alanine ligase